MGSGVFIGTDAILETAYPHRLSIGNGVVVGHRALIIAHFRESDSFRGEDEAAVVIEDDVFIGPNVTILPNVRIGHGAVVTAGSVVSQSVPPLTMVQGVPARPVARCGVAAGDANAASGVLSTAPAAALARPVCIALGGPLDRYRRGGGAGTGGLSPGPFALGVARCVCGEVRDMSDTDHNERPYVLDLGDLDRTELALVGGKAANLGELMRIDGIRVPPGFCVTTGAYRRIMPEAPSIGGLLERLSRLQPDDREAIRALSAEVRRVIEDVAIPDDLAAEIVRPLARLGERAAYAVRSSATAEDLPTASFAGQQDTYLNVVGPAAIVRSRPAGAGRRCSPSGRSAIGCATASTTAMLAWRWSCSGWCSRGGGRPVHGGSGHLQPEGCRAWRPASGWERRWSPAA